MVKVARKKGHSSAAGQNTGEIVLSAIKKLVRNTGWTARTIVKFIKMEYTINDPKLSRKVSRALKRGVRLGLLQMDRGRYRLNDISRITRPMSIKEERMRRILQPRLGAMRFSERPLRFRSITKTNKKRKS